LTLNKSNHSQDFLTSVLLQKYSYTVKLKIIGSINSSWLNKIKRDPNRDQLVFVKLIILSVTF